MDVALGTSNPRVAGSNPAGRASEKPVDRPNVAIKKKPQHGYFLWALALEEISLERHDVGGLQNAVSAEYGDVDAVEVAVGIVLHVLKLQPTSLFDNGL